MLQYLNHLSSSSLDSLQYVHVSLVLGSPELDTLLQMWLLQCWVEGKDHLPWPAGNTPPNAGSQHLLLATFAARAHCWLTFSLLLTGTKSFPAKLLSKMFFPASHSVSHTPTQQPPLSLKGDPESCSQWLACFDGFHAWTLGLRISWERAPSALFPGIFWWREIKSVCSFLALSVKPVDRWL